MINDLLKEFCLSKANDYDSKQLVKYFNNDRQEFYKMANDVLSIAARGGMSAALFESFLEFTAFAGRYVVTYKSRNSSPSNEKDIE
ncbi:MAG: hypothetical protein Q4B26_10985 [Eubacteriales bacterium]|nr:hypothetical protein [Eubacteriales bacterium]